MAEFEVLLTAKAEWKPHQIAKAGDISALAAAATNLAETVKSTLQLASAGMEVVKLMAQLQNINPLLIALDALADEVLKQIKDLKEAGYYYLYVDPYYKVNVTPKQKYDYGFEQLRNEGGDRIWSKKDSAGNWKDTTEQPTKAQIDEGVVKPHLATPRKLIPAGYNDNDPIPDPLRYPEDGGVSKYPQFTVKEVINEFVKAFDDEGDVPRYKKKGKVSALPKKGEDVYDVDGNVYTGWDPDKDFGLELFDLGKASEDGKIIKNYEAARKAINTRVAPGKPNQLGNTNFEGGCGAIAIIIAAADFSTFRDVFNKFSQMFSDIPEFSASQGKNLLDALTEIITPNDVTLKLTQCDSDYKLFKEGDIIGGKRYGSLGEIRSVNATATVATTMTGWKEERVVDDVGVPLTFNGKPLSKKVEFDMNANERWMNMEVTVSPIRSVDGYNPWIPGDTVLEMEKRGTYGAATEGFANYSMVGQGTVELPGPRRVYPKVGKVAKEKLMVLPDSIPPDFGGIRIKDIVPGWGEFFQMLENFVLQLKGMISDSAAFIQDMIDMLAQVEAFLQHIIDIIDQFLEFFRITLPSSGVFALYIPNQSGGNEGLKQEIKNATGLPDHGYASGILFVGTEGDKLIAGGGSKNPIDLLALVLGLLNNEDEPEPEDQAAIDKKEQDTKEGIASAIDKSSEDAEKWQEKSTADKLATLLL
tara:strand:- start:5282 stop:7381 length:2100 start_codon:yes stop_codon:yes gene_type:complete